MPFPLKGTAVFNINTFYSHSQFSQEYGKCLTFQFCIFLANVVINLEPNYDSCHVFVFFQNLGKNLPLCFSSDSLKLDII